MHGRRRQRRRGEAGRESRENFRRRTLRSGNADFVAAVEETV